MNAAEIATLVVAGLSALTFGIVLTTYILARAKDEKKYAAHEREWARVKEALR